MVSPAQSTNSNETDVTAQSKDCGVEAETPLAQEQCHETRKEFLREFTKAVKVAIQSYTRQDSAARDRGENFDGPVYVDCESQISPWFTAEELGLVCQSARRGARVDAFQASGKVVVRECASGFRHSEAAYYVGGMVGGATSDYSNNVPRYVRKGSGGMFGTNVISAPDVAVRSVYSANGTPLRDTPEAPVLFCEIEDNNRTLPALIRHLGMLQVNFPNLNGVVGIKGGTRQNGDQWAVLMFLQGTAVTTLLDFGPSPLVAYQTNLANTTLTLPVPPIGAEPVARQHGAGAVAANLPVWERMPNGQNAAGGGAAVFEIPANALLAGSHARGGVALAVPANAVPARISLEELVIRYFED
jgi:hypothetical protein